MTMHDSMDRRTALKLVAAAPIGFTLTWTEPEVMIAQQRAAAARASGRAHAPEFFTAAEWQTVRLLADLIIPRDERSGSATDVGVPEFIDFMMLDQPGRQEPMRHGLAWLDAETGRRHGRPFVACTAAEHAALLDEIAWPRRASASLREGTTFFLSFRNLVLTGFWTSKVGVADLEYQGNTFVPRWEGCPPAALERLGVAYHE